MPLLSRQEALELLGQYIKNQNMFRHCLASEAAMAALAKRLGQNEEKWAQAGLLHDLDVEMTNADLKVHGLESSRILQEKGLDEDVVEAIKLHNEMSSGIPRSATFHYALAAAETLTGLVTATTLVYPDKKLASVKVKSVTKRMKERQFAASVNREIIMECEKIPLPLEEFATIVLQAMQSISNDLGL